MIHNAWAEMGANAKLFYDAFRGLCRLRYEYAISKIVEDDEHWDHKTIDCPAHKRIEFWTNVAEYWKGKLKLSYQWEKDYFGSENEKSLDSEV